MRADVVIVGGGVIGSSVAYHLAGAGERSVIVIERDPSYAQASSALSASSIRQQFTTPACIRMSNMVFTFSRILQNISISARERSMSRSPSAATCTWPTRPMHLA